ncbi:MAG: hypothetical protein KJ063_07200 [Anaerolineae bacterium]|nr:hypothetical protein [Anaerolineae bacterium]
MASKQQRERSLQRQITRVTHQLNRLQERGRRLTTLRLLSFFGGIGLSGVAFFTLGPPGLAAGLLLTAIAFLTAVAIHQRVEQHITRHQTWIQIKQTHLARMNLAWEQLPPPLVIPQSERHPLEVDLDLLGKRGLHRLINVAVTPEGSQRLRQWLIRGEMDEAVTAKRQALAAELRPRPLFRDKLALAGMLKATTPPRLQTDPTALASLRFWLMLLGGAAAINILLLLLNLAGIIGPVWQVGVVLALIVTGIQGQRMGDLFKDAAALRDALEQWLGVFSHLEKGRYTKNPHLRELCQPFIHSPHPPSHFLRRVSRIVDAAGVRGNPIVWLLLNAFFPWDIFFSYRLEQAKIALARQLPTWLDVWHELEASSSLANLAYLNPHYIMPTIRIPAEVDTPFAGSGLGHPLIPEDHKVRNDFTFDQVGRLFLITGSNMAGKSTFLRTVGLNLVLAYAGGPVDAHSLSVVPGRLFTCIRVTDSLADGISYFYAEVRRLRQLLDELTRPHPHPLFFFVDEIFRGTNNRERLIGSRAMISQLADGPGLGLIATHDLELISLADTIPTISNIHFREEVHDGQMVFDYHLRSGPCPTTNALKIMALAGLPV